MWVVIEGVPCEETKLYLPVTIAKQLKKIASEFDVPLWKLIFNAIRFWGRVSLEDTVRLFVRYAVVKEPGHLELKSDVYELYKLWCMSRLLNYCNPVGFFRLLRKYIDYTEVYKSGNKYLQGIRVLRSSGYDEFKYGRRGHG